MKKKLAYLLCMIVFTLNLSAYSEQFIDVVIPCSTYHSYILDKTIKGIRENCQNIRRIIVVSEKKPTNQCEWFPENKFPFTKKEIAETLFTKKKDAENYLKKKNRLGWLHQQLIKLYSPLIIDGISENVLVLDADTIFLNSTSFLTPEGAPLFNVGTEYHAPYFSHAKRVLPNFKRVHELSGITHHMLFQKRYIQYLFQDIRKEHNGEEPWKVLIKSIDLNHLPHSSMSEYEIYFNYVLALQDGSKIRHLKWKNIGSLNRLQDCKRNGYHFVSYQKKPKSYTTH